MNMDKVNIYGYDDAMLEDLNDYLLEGEIDPEQMRADNSVIMKTLMDGQGNYDGIDVKPGDELTLTTISSQDVPQEALRFQGKCKGQRRISAYFRQLYFFR